MDFPIRLGIIGCGAVTEFSYLPAMTGIEGLEIVTLVDKDVGRGSRLAQRYKIKQVATAYQDIVGDVDAVIIALPNQLHGEVAIFFLREKIHVLIEKPMATSGEDCTAMICEAEEGGCKLAVGHVRRFFHNSNLIKQIIDCGWIGAVESFTLKDGGVFSWPTASGFYFRPERSGGGVLIDTGSHLLDLLFWWLGYPKNFDYYDDNFGGVEATSIVEVEMEGGAEGIVKMTRLVPIESGFTIRGTKGYIKARPFAFDRIKIFLDGLGEYELRSPVQYNIQHYFKLQVIDFIESIKKDRKPFVDGYEGRRVIQFIRDCYDRRQLLRTPWIASSSNV